ACFPHVRFRRRHVRGRGVLLGRRRRTARALWHGGRRCDPAVSRQGRHLWQYECREEPTDTRLGVVDWRYGDDRRKLGWRGASGGRMGRLCGCACGNDHRGVGREIAIVATTACERRVSAPYVRRPRRLTT